MIWQAHGRAPIRPMLDRLSFTQGRRAWGYIFRTGLFPATKADLDVIAAALDPVPTDRARADLFAPHLLANGP